MHRYEELEKIYYKKLYLKAFIGFILFVIFIAISVIFLNSTKNKKKENLSSNTSKVIAQTKKETAKNNKKNNFSNKKELNTQKIKKEATNNQELKFILPNIDFIKEPVESKKTKKTIISKKEKTKPQLKEAQKKNIPNVSTQNIKIKENNVNITDLINDFKTNKDYNLAITIAKIYFKQNNLKKAQIWALNANNLVPSKPESWIIFADIMIKKHNLQKARDLLKVYIDSYGSNDIIEEKLRSINGK